MIRWLRVVWPPWWTVLGLLLVWYWVQAPMLALEWSLKELFFPARDPEVVRLLTAVLGVAAGLYALYRVWAFHPAMRSDYHQWLTTTPWTARKPLPLGPLHLVPQDVLLLGAIVLLGWPRLQWLALVPVQVFLVVYLLALGVLHWLTGVKTWGYAVGFAAGFTVLAMPDMLLFIAVSLATLAVAYLGLRRSLAGFPWENLFVTELRRQLVGKGTQPLGWPYDQLGARFPQLVGVTPPDALFSGALAGFWFFVGSYQLRFLPDAAAGRYAVYFVFLGPAVGIRIAVYCYGYVPPLSVLGRLVHGRWIIPGYDHVFVAPLLTVGVGAAALYVPRATGIDSLWTTPIAFALTWWVIFGMGPPLQPWRLTGNHRISPGVFSARFTR
jgi:hypothetical protein